MIRHDQTKYGPTIENGEGLHSGVWKGHISSVWTPVDILGTQLETPHEAWIRYVKRRTVQSLVLVALSRSDARALWVHRGISPHSLPSVPFIDIALNSFFIP